MSPSLQYPITMTSWSDGGGRPGLGPALGPTLFASVSSSMRCAADSSSLDQGSHAPMKGTMLGCRDRRRWKSTSCGHK